MENPSDVQIEHSDDTGQPYSWEHPDVLHGLLPDEHTELFAFKQQCPPSMGARVYFGPDMRIVAVDMRSITSSNREACLKVDGGPFTIPNGIAHANVNIYSDAIPELPDPPVTETVIEDFANRLRDTAGSAGGDIADVQVRGKALYVSVRVLPFHCEQTISMDFHGHPLAFLSEPSKRIILEAISTGIPVSYVRELADPTWKVCQSGDSECVSVAVGC